jgi:hypothetical protein
VKRTFLCFFLIAANLACGGVERQRFVRLDEAGRAIEQGISQKADLARFRQLLDAFATELAAAGPRVSTVREGALLSRYQEAYTGLTDMRLVWEARQARGSDMLPIREDLPARIAREYELGVNTNEPPSIYANEALEAIWARTREKLATASRSLNGDTVEKRR